MIVPYFRSESGSLLLVSYEGRMSRPQSQQATVSAGQGMQTSQIKYYDEKDNLLCNVQLYFQASGVKYRTKWIQAKIETNPGQSVILVLQTRTAAEKRGQRTEPGHIVLKTLTFKASGAKKRTTQDVEAKVGLL